MVGAERVAQCCGFSWPLGVGEFVEGKHAAYREVRPDGAYRVAGRLVQVEVKVGQGDDGVRVVRQVARERFPHIALDDQRSPDVAEVFALLMSVQHLAQVA